MGLSFTAFSSVIMVAARHAGIRTNSVFIMNAEGQASRFSSLASERAGLGGGGNASMIRAGIYRPIPKPALCCHDRTVAVKSRAARAVASVPPIEMVACVGHGTFTRVACHIHAAGRMSWNRREASEAETTARRAADFDHCDGNRLFLRRMADLHPVHSATMSRRATGPSTRVRRHHWTSGGREGPGRLTVRGLGWSSGTIATQGVPIDLIEYFGISPSSH